MAMRQAISKSLRFRIFDRDTFTCRYCGKCPPEVKLVIDHVVPVADGGGNDETNLITSCVECNQGKGAKQLQAGLSEPDQRRRAQELLEQIDMAELTKRAKKASDTTKKQLLEYFRDCTGCNEVQKGYLSSLVTTCFEFGPGRVFQWLDQANSKTYQKDGRWDKAESVMRYFYGIIRNVRAEGQD